MPTPLLLISDAPTSGTGLGRITRDLATRIATNLPEIFRVGTFGYGGIASRGLPFQQYIIEGMHNWVLPTLPEIWKDFAGDEKGVIFTVWDASRLLWFARPENCPAGHLQKFLRSGCFERWGYFPIDATGPHDRLTAVIKHTIEAYDRVLAYSKWAADILRRTFTPTEHEVDHLPHGIDTSVFQPRNRSAARHGFGERIGARNQKGKFLSIPDDSFMVGIVATNQMRKDYGLGISTVAELARERNVMLWIHLDELERHWSVPALLNDFGLTKNTVVTSIPLTDEQMSWCFSACDVTIGPGLGEGFGLPIFESIACGTPCVHGDYGGAAEHLPDHLKVTPETYRIEGLYNCIRPVFDPCKWAQKCVAAPKYPVVLPPCLDWNNLWGEWEQWLKDGTYAQSARDEVRVSSC